MRLSTIAMLGLLSGCGAVTGSISNAALNTGLAAGVAATHKARGGCLSTCTHGLVCDRATGYCEARPCGKGCGPNQYCDQQPGQEDRCSDAGLLPNSRPAPAPSAAPVPVN